MDKPYLGYGHRKLPGEKYFRGYKMNEREADALLRKDLNKFIALFAGFKPMDAPLLGVLSYNIGPGAVMKSSFYRKLKAGDRNIFKSYVAHCKYKGRFHKGLYKRRCQEFAALYVPYIYTNGYDSFSCIHLLYCDKSHYQQFTPPFDIPESWEWVRLEDISYAVLGKMLDKSKNKGVNHPYLRNINVRWFEFDVSDLLEMPFEMQEADRYSIKHGDLVICEGGEPGRCAVWDKTEPIMFQKALHRVRFFGEINSHFISNIIYLYCLNGFITTFFTGSGIKHLTGESLANIPIPMPPIKEQQRILKSAQAENPVHVISRKVLNL